MQPKFIQVDPETAHYARMLREGERLAQQRLLSLDRKIKTRTILFWRRAGLGIVALIVSACAVAAIGLTWNTFWAGVGASIVATAGVSALIVCLFWASEVER